MEREFYTYEEVREAFLNIPSDVFAKVILVNLKENMERKSMKAVEINKLTMSQRECIKWGLLRAGKKEVKSV